MAVLPRLAATPAAYGSGAASPPPFRRSSPPHPPSASAATASYWKRNRWSNNTPRRTFGAAAFGGGIQEYGDPLFQAALRAAWVRDQESRRPDPLFIDPYAAGLLSFDMAHQDTEGTLVSDVSAYAYHYRLATKFIDEKLQHLMSSSDDLRQMGWTPVHIG